MFLPLSTIFVYLSASPTSRCIIEGEAILAASHIVVCGVTEKINRKWNIRSYCLQTSAVKCDPHVINGILSITSIDKVEIERFFCSCKAGSSESCKHVAATLLFCSRKPLDELDELSPTDTECLWKNPKIKAVNKYLPQPLNCSNCFKAPKGSSRKRVYSQEEVANMFEMATSALPNSSFSLHRQGRRQNIETIEPVMEIPSHLESIFQNSAASQFLRFLDLDIPALPECCKMVIDIFKKDEILKSMGCEQGTGEWKQKRRNKITGSTCYSIFTFKKEDWTKMLSNFFHPKSVLTKEMKHGLEQESCAIEAFSKMNGNVEIKKMGIMICSKYPWLAYSPDGIIFENGKPSKLLEIKCPYLGKIKSGNEVMTTLKYLNKDFTLKQRHSYYAQIQFGMALLNLSKCEFIVYFSKEENYLQISVPFNEHFARQLIETVTTKYFEKMIHYICNNSHQ